MADRTLRLTNTKTRQLEEIRPIEPGHLRFYSCGPTVYSFAHIGNFRTFLTADLVVRTAESLGWRVSYVSNITDVGHLTEDDVADSGGEDKMERALKSKDGEQFANVWDLADHYANAFKADWERLNLRKPMVWPKATQHMREQIQAIEKLIADGHAYATPTGVYFRVSSYDRYGSLSGNVDTENLMTAVRDVVVDPNKENPADFALWKLDDKHLMQWYSPWGWGFPGWHIECSVMAMKYLGETIDLHGGGEDLVFPHHEAECAQSECLTGHSFSNHWIHTRFLQVDGEKMSKSKGNWFTVRDLVDGRNADPIALRYALISVPYGKPSNFTMQTLRDAEKNVDRFRECRRLAAKGLAEGETGEDTLSPTLNSLADAALDAMCNDLNTSEAIAQALAGTGHIFTAAMNRNNAAAAEAYLDRIEALLGIAPPLHRKDAVAEAESEPTFDGRPISAWIAERAALKQSKQFAEADALRQRLELAGIELRDTPEGTTWKQKANV